MTSEEHSGESRGEALVRWRQATAVLRVVVGADGTLRHGELLDASGAMHERFAGWEGLLRTLEGWIEREGRAGQGPAREEGPR